MFGQMSGDDQEGPSGHGHVGAAADQYPLASVSNPVYLGNLFPEDFFLY